MTILHHWLSSLRPIRRAIDAPVVAAFYAEAQPRITHLIEHRDKRADRRMVVRLGGQGHDPIEIELVVTDPQQFLADVQEGAEWVERGDPEA